MNVKQMASTARSNDKEKKSDDKDSDNQKETIFTDKRKVEQATSCGNHETSSGNKNNDNQQKTSPIDGKETTQQSTSIDNENISNQQEISMTNIKTKSLQEARGIDQNDDNQLQTFLTDVKEKEKLGIETYLTIDKEKQKLNKEINSKADKFNPSITAYNETYNDQKHKSSMYNKNEDNSHRIRNGKGFLGALLAFLTCSRCYGYDVSNDSNDRSDAISTDEIADIDIF